MPNEPCIHGVPDLGRTGCPECERSWKNLRAREAFIQHHGDDDSTCKGCEHAETCSSAWDLYNTCGDCILEK